MRVEHALETEPDAAALRGRALEVAEQRADAVEARALVHRARALARGIAGRSGLAFERRAGGILRGTARARLEGEVFFGLALLLDYAHSILARISEETFEYVKNNIDIEIDDVKNPFRNWNHFAYRLLTECHAQYKIPEYEEWHDDYSYVGDDFKRDEGADYGLPRRMYAEEDEEYEEDEDQEDEDD